MARFSQRTAVSPSNGSMTTLVYAPYSSPLVVVPVGKLTKTVHAKHEDLLTDLSLDLTAASTVHLLEPQWNPSLEDQALARVHRLGQIRPVTTIRYVMEDSFEEVLTPRYVWKYELTRASIAHPRSSRSQEAARHHAPIERVFAGGKQCAHRHPRDSPQILTRRSQNLRQLLHERKGDQNSV